jgi:MazG family protein
MIQAESVPIRTTGTPMSQIESLLEIMQTLRDPEKGCPWDLKQTYETITPYTLEEVYEVIDAIENGEIEDLREELGDLLFQIVFYAQIGKERDEFNFADVVNDISEKLIRRHPHVFAGKEIEEGELAAAWDQLKQEENVAKENTDHGVMDNIPLAFPALTRAAKIQNRAAKVGFDWDNVGPVWEKLTEEIEELQEAVNDNLGHDKMEDELGDLLCVCVNLGRHLNVDPEKALRRSNTKFERRFRYIEQKLKEQGRKPEQASLEEMDALWDQAKLDEKKGHLGEVP